MQTILKISLLWTIQKKFEAAWRCGFSWQWKISVVEAIQELADHHNVINCISLIHPYPPTHSNSHVCVCGWCFTFSFKSINDSHVGKSISWNIKWLHIPFQFVHQSPWRWRKSIRFSVIYKFFRCLCSNSNLHPVKIQEAIWQETKTQLFPLER